MFFTKLEPFQNYKWVLIITSISFLLRMFKAGNIALKKSVKIGDNDVSRKIFSIVLMAFIIMYIAAGTFMVVENSKRSVCN